ncbi:MAG: T9SS type A sorting domain-containing protein, partial [Bacteroidales bacterium]
IASINATKDTVQVLLLNKSAERSRVRFLISGFAADNKVLTDWFDELGISKTEEIELIDSSYILPAYSFMRLQFTGNTSTSEILTGMSDENLLIKKSGDKLQVIMPDGDRAHQIDVFDMSGVLRISFPFSGNTATVPLLQLRSGCYLLSVKGLKKTYIEKVIL